MRFMMFMIPNISEGESGPSAEDVAAMTRYNSELERAGVLLSLDGLRSASEGARVSFSSDATPTPIVTDGPFSEAKEVVGGYWMINVRDRAEAIEWARRCPAGPGDIIEIRQVWELEDFSPEIVAAAEAAQE